MKRIYLYLLFSFGIAWALWIGCYAMSASGFVIQFASMAAMWAPAAAVWLTKKVTRSEKIISTSLRPRFRREGNVRLYLAAWLLPAVFTLLGAVLFFLFYRGAFDSSLSYLRLMMEQSGQSPQGAAFIALIVVQIASALTYGPAINTFFAVGEEIGWRGFLFPELALRTTRVKAHVLTGFIWGMWHTPVNMLGHNYGLDYPGYPWTGVVAMCIFTFSLGVLLSWLTEKSRSIWPAALCHGAVNAAAGIPFLFLSVDAPVNRLMGPALSGLIAGVPMLIFALVLLLRERKKSARPSSPASA